MELPLVKVGLRSGEGDMINGAHIILYSTDAEADRVFIRDVLGFVGVDAGDGWLIFKLPPGELGIHPTDPGDSGRHELYLMCDDIEQTVKELKAKGVEFSDDITDAGFGRRATLKVPGGGELGLYQSPTRRDRTVGWRELHPCGFGESLGEACGSHQFKDVRVAWRDGEPLLSEMDRGRHRVRERLGAPASERLGQTGHVGIVAQRDRQSQQVSHPVG